MSSDTLSTNELFIWQYTRVVYSDQNQTDELYTSAAMSCQQWDKAHDDGQLSRFLSDSLLTSILRLSLSSSLSDYGWTVNNIRSDLNWRDVFFLICTYTWYTNNNLSKNPFRNRKMKLMVRICTLTKYILQSQFHFRGSAETNWQFSINTYHFWKGYEYPYIVVESLHKQFNGGSGRGFFKVNIEQIDLPHGSNNNSE